MPDNLPQDIRAEASVLAAAMIDPEHCWARVATLDPDVFSISSHRAWHAAIRALPKPDLVTVNAWLTDHGLAGECSMDYMLRAMADCPGTANLDKHIEIVQDRRLRRRLIATARSIAELAASGEMDGAEAAAKAASDFVALTSVGAQEELVSLADAIMEVIDEAEEAHKSKQAVGIPTGFTALDALTGGLQPSDMIVIAARPSEGKTTLLTQIMLHAVKVTGKTGLMITREMRAKAIARRLLAGMADIEQFQLRTGHLSDAQWERIRQASGELLTDLLKFSDASHQTLASIRAKALALRVEGKLGLVGVDYLQLIDEPRIKGESRAEQVARISGGLKALARELEVPVVVLSQLRRATEERKGPPDLDDLRESGAIEQDADVVMMIHTPDKDHKHDNVRPVDLILAKQRNGPTGLIHLAFDRPRSRFLPADMTHTPPPAPRRRSGDD